MVRSKSRLVVVKASKPNDPEAVGSARIGENVEDVAVVNLYNPPFLQTFALISSGDQFDIVDVTKSDDPQTMGTYGALRGANAVAVEAMPLDRLIDEAGRAWKDISHEGRFFSRQEVDKILRADVILPRRPQGPTPPGGSDRQRSGRK